MKIFFVRKTNHNIASGLYPGDSAILKNSYNFKQLQATPGNSRQLQATPGNSRQLHETPENSRKLPATSGNPN